MTKLLYLILPLILLSSPCSMAQEKILDIIDAEKWCDKTPLHRVEGIWNYPEDDVTVLVKRDDLNDGFYKIFSLETGDDVFRPGECIGTFQATSDPLKFKLKLYTRRKKNYLTSPKECAATLTLDDYAMQVEYKSRKFSFNPFFLLPKFWRIARFSSSDPIKSLPFGMRKIYPSYDGNGSSRFNARYL